MQLAHLVHELALGFGDVEQGLPGSGCGKNITKYTGWPSRSATPTCESSLKPPMPGPWPARGSMIT